MKIIETSTGEFIEAGKDEPQVLYEILLDEYKLLGFLTESEIEDIRVFEKKKAGELELKSEKNINKKYPERKERDKEIRKQFILKGYHRLEMLSEVRRRIHAPKNEKQPVALCLSGGGIRSATFGLGVLQGLAKHNLLDKFDYLSTVSGGGYIGSWLSAWIHRSGSISRVQAELKNEKNKAPDENEKKEKPDEVEPREITYLRSYSNYMSPRIGLFSADTWALIAVYLRNLILNWTVVVPLLAAILMLPKLLVSINALNVFKYKGTNQLIILMSLILVGLFGFVNLNAMRPSLSKFSWVGQNYKFDDIGLIKSAEPKVLWWCLIPLLTLAFGITIFWAWTKGQREYTMSDWLPDFFKLNIELTHLILFSVILFLFSFLIARWFIYFFGNTENSVKLWGSFFLELILSIASSVLGGALLYLIAVKIPKSSSFIPEKLASVFGQSDADSIAQMLYVCFSVPTFLLVFLLSATFFVGVASKITTDMDREWVARFGAWVLIVIVGWSVISSVVLFGPLLFEIDWTAITASIGIGGISGLVTLILGFSRRSPAGEEKEPKSRTSFLLWFAPQIAAPIFALFLIILISYGTNELLNLKGTTIIESPVLNLLIWFIIFAGIGGFMGWFININKFSLHAIYRERLIRAYLGASRTTKRLITADSFTDLDSDNDNIEMKDLPKKPFHVVNMTLNLAKSNNLQWQNRKAESFTATALHCGSSNMGGSGNYRRSENYGCNKQVGQAITLGTAAAISGAAASPNMGYYTSSAAVSFLMALFNIRLGWWLGNTGKRGDNTYNLATPRFSPRLFFAEAFGRTNDTNPYIYLSDGGHFENLGIYEMVLRRCKLIVVCDASADPRFTFSDLGNAVHKIRVDMGISIEFKKERRPKKGGYITMAEIKYSQADGEAVKDGILLYIKPTLDESESIDIVNYQSTNVDFPHESTSDQMYSETQFESYRSLGFYMINTICSLEDKSQASSNAENKPLADIFGFKVKAERYLGMPNKETPVDDNEG